MGADDGSGPEIGYTGARFGGMSRRKARQRADSAGREMARWEAVTEMFAAVGPGGDVAPDVPPEITDRPEDSSDDGDGPVVGYTGARFGGGSRRRRGPDRQPEPAAGQAAEDLEPPTVPGFEPGEHVEPSRSTPVRPYVFTRGRTRSQFELSIEALVSIVPSARVAHLSAEHHAVVLLCRESRSVAEIAALLGVPIGVARVLVGDLAGAGAVSLHRTAGAAGPDQALMERVLAGLRRL